MLIGLTIILFILSIFLILFKKLKIFKIENKFLEIIFDEKITEFIVNICITIIGVTLAILLTNYDVQKQETKKEISMLNSLDRELKMIEDNIDVYILFYENYKEQKKEENFLQLHKEMPITPLYTLEPILDNELVVTNANYHSYAALIDSQRSIYASYNRLEHIENVNDLVNELITLRDSCSFMRGIIQIEIAFQNKEISEKDMQNAVNQYYEEKLIVE